jgi:hypothetical protein
MRISAAATISSPFAPALTWSTGVPHAATSAIVLGSASAPATTSAGRR